jgi:hypothetical protein
MKPFSYMFCTIITSIGTVILVNTLGYTATFGMLLILIGNYLFIVKANQQDLEDKANNIVSIIKKLFNEIKYR